MRRAWILLCSLLALIILAAPYSSAEGKGRSGKITKENSLTPPGQWIQPSAKTKAPILVQAGRSQPLKFQLVESSGPVTSVDMVQIVLNTLTSCEPTAAIKASPIPLLSPTTPSSSPSAQSSSSPSSSAISQSVSDDRPHSLRVENGVFIFNWKVSKELKADCYQVVARTEDLTIKSPIFKVRSKK